MNLAIYEKPLNKSPANRENYYEKPNDMDNGCSALPSWYFDRLCHNHKRYKGSLQVQITNCSEAIPCTATNKKGSWDFTAPGPVRFKKSDESLTITCKDGPANLTVQIAPVRGGMAWGNIIFGGIIGGGVDSGTDAHWETVDSLNISRGYCNGKPLN